MTTADVLRHSVEHTHENLTAWLAGARAMADTRAEPHKAVVDIDPFVDLIGRHFKQPKEGLGNDGSPVAHMWRTIANPDAPL